jgi:hypothetical protein
MVACSGASEPAEWSFVDRSIIRSLITPEL